VLLKNDCFTYASTSLLAFATHEQIAYGVTVTPSLPPPATRPWLSQPERFYKPMGSQYTQIRSHYVMTGRSSVSLLTYYSQQNMSLSVLDSILV
jgi:hypothetical protein